MKRVSKYRQNGASIHCFGADFWVGSPYDFSSTYASNRFFFDGSFAADPNLDYTQWANRKKAQYLDFYIGLLGYAAANKQLALIFGFDVLYQGDSARVLVYTDNRMLKDQQLVYGDNQFLIKIDSLDQYFSLYFIHAGDSWFFRGLSGYVI